MSDALLAGKRLQTRRASGLTSRFTRQRNQLDRADAVKVKVATTEEDLKVLCLLACARGCCV